MTAPQDHKVAAGRPARPVEVIVELIDHSSRIAGAHDRADLVERLGIAKDRITDPQIRVSSPASSSRARASCSTHC